MVDGGERTGRAPPRKSDPCFDYPTSRSPQTLETRRKLVRILGFNEIDESFKPAGEIKVRDCEFAASYSIMRPVEGRGRVLIPGKFCSFFLSVSL